jgi:hypothetical protein
VWLVRFGDGANRDTASKFYSSGKAVGACQQNPHRMQLIVSFFVAAIWAHFERALHAREEERARVSAARPVVLISVGTGTHPDIDRPPPTDGTPRVVLISFGTHPDIELPPNGAAVCIGRNHQPYFDDFYVSGDHCVVRVVSDATAPRGCAVAFEMRGQNAAAILRHRLSAEWESAARSDREVVLCHGDVLRLLSINTGAWNYTVAVS